MNTTDLQHELNQFTGTGKWRRHPLNPRVLHTDGVEYFAEKAGAYWFIDAIALGIYGRAGPGRCLRRSRMRTASASSC